MAISKISSDALGNASGNLGIGTNSPTTQKLHISAASVSGPSNNPAGLRITDTGTNENIQLVNRSGNMLSNVETGNSYSWQINDTEVAAITSASLFQFNSGYGSVATAYGCRAWVNFKGTDTVTINASGNVSSVSDLAAGQYGINFTNAMPDVNCSVATCIDRNGSGAQSDNAVALFSFASTSQLRIFTSRSSVGDYYDMLYVTTAVFR